MTKECSTTGCPRPMKARGMCNACYERWRRNGHDGVPALRPLRKPDASPAEALRFLLKRTKEEGDHRCLIWQGRPTKNGYARIFHKGVARNGHAVTRMLVDEIILGDDRRPDGTIACHSRQCISRACINPMHIRWDTPSANNIDAREMRRVAGQKLTQADADAIRTRCEGGESQRAVGADYGICQQNVSAIVTGKSWK